MKAYRHGDVIIRELSAHEYSYLMSKRAKNTSGSTSCQSVVLAEGEVTGHSHKLETTQIKDKILVDSGSMFFFDWSDRPNVLEGITGSEYKVMNLTGPSKLTHEEHKQIDLPAGKFIVYQQRETWTGSAPRRVYD